MHLIPWLLVDWVIAIHVFMLCYYFILLSRCRSYLPANWEGLSYEPSITPLSPPFTSHSHSKLPSMISIQDHSTAIHSLDQVVFHYFISTLSSSTHKTYKAAEKRYLQFCSNFLVSPLPVTENILYYFVACMGQEGLACFTIQTYLSGIHQLQVAAGFQDPHIDQMPCLRQLLRGIKVQAARAGRQPWACLPEKDR